MTKEDFTEWVTYNPGEMCFDALGKHYFISSLVNGCDNGRICYFCDDGQEGFAKDIDEVLDAVRIGDILLREYLPKITRPYI